MFRVAKLSTDMKRVLAVFLLLSLYAIFFSTSIPRVLAIDETDTPASLVVGQSGFRACDVAFQMPDLQTGLYWPVGITKVGERLIIGDSLNNRINIYNTTPTSNNAIPDVVIGQTDLCNTSYRGVNAYSISGLTLYSSGFIKLSSDGTRLFAVDLWANRVLIWNSIFSGRCPELD